jgi:hypothetical protein
MGFFMKPRFNKKAADHASPKLDFGLLAEAVDKLLLIFLSAGDFVKSRLHEETHVGF